MRLEDIQQNNDIVQSLAAFQKYGNDQIPLAPNTGRVNPQRGGGFFSGVLTALTGVAVSLSLCFSAPLPPTVSPAVNSVEIDGIPACNDHCMHGDLLGCVILWGCCVLKSSTS